MRPQNKLGPILIPVLLFVYVFNQAALGQQKTAQPQSTDEVLRINTELVQTRVTVFDKQGRFVDGLNKSDFELRVDGRLVPILFFENIVAGSQRDRLANFPRKNVSTPVKDATPALSFRQHTIIFFLDDLHLSLDSVGRTRKMLSNFIDKENAAQAVSNNLAARVQVYRDGQTVISTPFKTVAPDKETDSERVPFNAEIKLAGLQAGRYILEVTVEDRRSQRTASQNTAFYVQ